MAAAAVALAVFENDDGAAPEAFVAPRGRLPASSDEDR
jgi:hypothetical protein